MIELLSNLLRIQAFLKTHVEQPADIKRRGVKTQRYTGDKEVECVISYRRNGTPDQISLSCRNSYSLQCTFSAFPDKLIMRYHHTAKLFQGIGGESTDTFEVYFDQQMKMEKIQVIQDEEYCKSRKWIVCENDSRGYLSVISGFRGHYLLRHQYDNNAKILKSEIKSSALPMLFLSTSSHDPNLVNSILSVFYSLFIWPLSETVRELNHIDFSVAQLEEEQYTPLPDKKNQTDRL